MFSTNTESAKAVSSFVLLPMESGGFLTNPQCSFILCFTLRLPSGCRINQPMEKALARRTTTARDLPRGAVHFCCACQHASAAIQPRKIPSPHCPASILRSTGVEWKPSPRSHIFCCRVLRVLRDDDRRAHALTACV